ncbi:EF-hand calcium-binding domain-containing protein 11 [Theristicus caerulescens]
MDLYPWRASTIDLEKSMFLSSAKKHEMAVQRRLQLYSNETRHVFTAFDVKDRRLLTFEDFKKAFNSAFPKLPERTIVEAFSNQSEPLFLQKAVRRNLEVFILSDIILLIHSRVIFTLLCKTSQ